MKVSWYFSIAPLLWAMPQLQSATITATYANRFTDNLVNISFNAGASSETVRISMFVMDRTGGTYAGSPAAGTSFNAWCVEYQENITFGGSATYNFGTLEAADTAVGGIGTYRANLIRELFGRFNPNLGMTPQAAVYNGTLYSGNTIAGALQLAIWKIEGDSSTVLGQFSFSSGNVRVLSADDAQVVALATLFVNSLTGNGPQLTNLYSLTRTGGQDILIQVPDTAVPEPGTAGLSILGGIAGFAMWRRRQGPRLG